MEILFKYFLATLCILQTLQKQKINTKKKILTSYLKYLRCSQNSPDGVISVVEWLSIEKKKSPNFMKECY